MPVHPAQGRADALLLEREVREQVLAEHVQRLDDPLAPVLAERGGGGLQLVELLRHQPVVALEAVDDRHQVRLGLAQRREQRDVLEPVVAVHEPAVVQAVHLQRPQRAVGLQRPDLRVQLIRRQAVGDALRELADGLQVLPDHAVDPQQLLEERLPERVAHDAA